MVGVRFLLFPVSDTTDAQILQSTQQAHTLTQYKLNSTIPPSLLSAIDTAGSSAAESVATSPTRLSSAASNSSGHSTIHAPHETSYHRQQQQHGSNSNTASGDRSQWLSSSRRQQQSRNPSTERSPGLNVSSRSYGSSYAASPHIPEVSVGGMQSVSIPSG